MYGDLGKGLQGCFVVMVVLSVCGVIAIGVLVVITANTWDCSIQIEQESDQNEKQ